MIQYRIASERDAADIAALAREVWTEHYAPLIGVQQVGYMLEKFQSEPAIAAAIAETTACHIAFDKETSVGYLALKPENDYLFLSKLYIRRDHRGMGIARGFFDIAAQTARQMSLPAIRLTVNKGNADSIAIYRHTGFAIVMDVVADIGNGYVMDDYVMEWKL